MAQSAPEEFIYVVTSDLILYVKIGLTRNPHTLRGRYSTPFGGVETYALFPCTDCQAVEAMAHALFNAHRVGGSECFRKTPDVDYVQQLAGILRREPMELPEACRAWRPRRVAVEVAHAQTQTEDVEADAGVDASGDLADVHHFLDDVVDFNPATIIPPEVGSYWSVSLIDLVTLYKKRRGMSRDTGTKNKIVMAMRARGVGPVSKLQPFIQGQRVSAGSGFKHICLK